MEITILTPADYDAYFALRLAGLEEFPLAFTTDADAWRGADRAVIERLLARSAAEPGAPIFGAWSAGALIGLLAMRQEERPTVRHKATLIGFYVAPTHRDQGVGRALLSALLAHGRHVSGLQQLRAVVNSSCTAALALLPAVGFRQFGVEERAKLLADEYTDQIYFWYLLAEERQ